VVQTETKEEHEDPPGQKPPHPWEDLPWEGWNDWRWQLSHRLNTAEDFALLIRLTPEEVTSLSAFGRFRVDVTPYFATLIDPDEPTCPIRRQVIPTVSELLPFETEMADSLAEDAHSPVPGLVHRYPELEINTLPGLNPTVSDLCIMARAGGMHYTDLINENLYLAADRYAKECRDMERQASGGNGRVRAFQEAVPVRG
jgi:hypothetical protein